MKRATAILAAGLLAMSATNASACREGRRDYPTQITQDNSVLLGSADRVFVALVRAPERRGDRVVAQLDPVRVIQGSSRWIAFEDAALPSTCAIIASKRLGSLTEGKPVLVIEKDGVGGFSVLIDEGGLLSLGVEDLLALLDPEVAE